MAGHHHRSRCADRDRGRTGRQALPAALRSQTRRKPRAARRRRGVAANRAGCRCELIANTKHVVPRRRHRPNHRAYSITCPTALSKMGKTALSNRHKSTNLGRNSDLRPATQPAPHQRRGWPRIRRWRPYAVAPGWGTRYRGLKIMSIFRHSWMLPDIKAPASGARSFARGSQLRRV